MDYSEFIFIVLVCHSSLELRLVLFLHGNQFVRNEGGRINRKNSESSLKFHARLSNIGGMMERA